MVRLSGSRLKSIGNVLVVLLLLVSGITGFAPLSRSTSAQTSSTPLIFSFSTPPQLFNGKPAGPNITITYKFNPNGVVDWFNSQGGNMSITPPLGTIVINYNSSAFWYSASGTINGATVSANIYFFKQVEVGGYPSPNMKVVIIGTTSKAISFSLSLNNIVTGATVSQPNSCSVLFTPTNGNQFAGVGFSWCDVNGASATYNSGTLTFSLAVGSFIIDPTTISTSTKGSATQYDEQNKVFFCNSNYWVFYTAGTQIDYRTSTDGATWSSAVQVTITVTNGYEFSLWDDCANNKIYYVIASGGGTLAFRSGTTSSTPSITWDSAEVSLTPARTDPFTPTITKDTSGNLWIADQEIKSSGSGASKGYYLEVYKCSTTCTTASNWLNSIDTLVVNTASPVGTNVYLTPDIVPLTSGKLAMVNGQGVPSGVSNVQIRTYSGTAWNAAVGTTSGYHTTEYSLLAISDTVYFAGSTNSIIFWSCAYPCSSAPTETTLDSSATFVNVGISSDGSSTLVVSYSPASTSTTVSYQSSTNSGSTWSGAKTLATSESVGTAVISMDYTKQNGVYPLVWTSNTGYNVRFATISLGASFTFTATVTPSLSPTFKQDPTPKISPALTDALTFANCKNGNLPSCSVTLPTSTIAITPSFVQKVAESFALTITLGRTLVQSLVLAFTKALTLATTFTQAVSTPFSKTLTLAPVFLAARGKTFLGALNMALTPAFHQVAGVTNPLSLSLSVLFHQGVSATFNAAISLGRTVTRALSLHFTSSMGLSPGFEQKVATSFSKGLSLLATLAAGRGFLFAGTLSTALTPLFHSAVSTTMHSSLALAAAFHQAISETFRVSMSLGGTAIHTISLIFTKSLTLSPLFHQAPVQALSGAISVLIGFNQSIAMSAYHASLSLAATFVQGVSTAFSKGLSLVVSFVGTKGAHGYTFTGIVTIALTPVIHEAVGMSNSASTVLASAFHQGVSETFNLTITLSRSIARTISLNFHPLVTLTSAFNTSLVLNAFHASLSLASTFVQGVTTSFSKGVSLLATFVGTKGGRGFTFTGALTIALTPVLTQAVNISHSASATLTSAFHQGVTEAFNLTISLTRSIVRVITLHFTPSLIVSPTFVQNLATTAYHGTVSVVSGFVQGVSTSFNKGITLTSGFVTGKIYSFTGTLVVLLSSAFSLNIFVSISRSVSNFLVPIFNQGGIPVPGGSGVGQQISWYWLILLLPIGIMLGYFTRQQEKNDN